MATITGNPPTNRDEIVERGRLESGAEYVVVKRPGYSARAAVERILDREARRLLDEQLAAEASGAATGTDDDPNDDARREAS
jgi:hypothetical protein